MGSLGDMFGPGSNPDTRIIPSLERMSEVVAGLRSARPNIKIVLTMGTFDLLHVGHGRYLEEARRHGDVLIVGIDSDEKTRKRKGPSRPIVSEDERLEMLLHTRHVDLATLKAVNEEKWALIKCVRPAVLIATQETYSPEQIEQLKNYCGEIKVLEPMATEGTTARIRRLFIRLSDEFKYGFNLIEEALEKLSLARQHFDEVIKRNAGDSK